MMLRAGRPSPGGRELWLALLASALLALGFVALPLFALPERVWAPSDVGQSFSLTRVEGAGGTTNGALGDVAVQMHAWLEFNRQELAAGRVPLWNPYNGGGAPHLANYQSAVFSPFHLPFYVLDFGLALVVSGWLKLWVLLFAGYLLARELGAGLRGAAVGAVVLAFAAHNVFLLQYPHSGVAACGALTLALSARWLRATDERPPARMWRCARPWLAAGLTLAFTAEAYAGHPEVLCFGALLWLAFVGLWLAQHARRTRRAAWSRALQLGLCALFAAGLSAPQWLPFLEYLQHSAILALRADDRGHLLLAAWPQLFFPNLFGAPPAAMLAHGTSLPDYSPQNVIYTGSLALLLALAGLALARAQRGTRFFAALGLTWWLVTHDVLGLGELVRSLPLVGLVPLNRSQFVWDVCIAMLAAQGASALFDGELLRRRVGRIALTTVAVGLLAFFTVGAWQRAVGLHAEAGTPPTPTWDAAHVAFIALTFAAGALLLLLAPARPLHRALVAGGLLLTLLAQTAWLTRDYLPLSDARTLHARTPALDQLAQLAGNGTVAVIGPDLLPPSLNLPHRIRLLQNYDALWIRGYDELYASAFGRHNNWRMLRTASEADLEAFGVDVVLVPHGERPFIERLVPEPGPTFVPEQRIDPGIEVVQALELIGYRLNGLTFMLHDGGRRNTASLTARLMTGDSTGVFEERTWKADELQFGSRGFARVRLDVGPMLVELTRLRLTLTSPDAGPGNSYGIVARRPVPGLERSGLGALMIGGRPVEGVLQLQITPELTRYAPARPLAGFDVYRRADPPARLRAFGAALEVLEELPHLVRARVRRELPITFETSIAAFPGWIAEVDGQRRPIEVLDGAFLSLALEPGEHVVEFRYEPASWSRGLKAALASLVLASGWLFLSARLSRSSSAT